jgi:Fe-S cluster assembly protein SufD
VVAGEGSSVSLVNDSYSADGGPQTLVAGAVEIICRPQAQVRYFDIERWNRGTYSFNTIRGRLERGSELTVASVGFGGRLTRSRVEAFLEGENSRASLVGVSFGDGEQHFDYQTLQDHMARGTASDLLYKAALTEKASEVWYGTVRIRKGASGSDANQTSRNLLLSSRAKAAPIPVLEIEQYDILRCSHGATAGPLDEEQLFYLESRGVDHEEAERMLVGAFFHEVLDRIPDQAVRAGIEEALTAKLAASRGPSGQQA